MRRTRRRVGAALACLGVVAAGTAAVVLPSGTAFAADSVSINGSTTYQASAGFGASEAFGQASGVMNSSSSVQSQVLSLLYSPTSGAGLTILRNEIGADSGKSIEPTSPGGPNATPSYKTLAQTNQDQGQLWFAQQIKSRFGVTNVYGDAWSAPGYMKTNGSALGGGQVCGTTGASCGSGDWRQAYANYLVQYAKDYAAAGVPLTYVGPSNEPDFSASYDSTTMSPAQMASLLDVLGPTVRNSGLSTATPAPPRRGAHRRIRHQQRGRGLGVQEHGRLAGGCGAQYLEQCRSDHLLACEHRRGQRRDGDPVPDEWFEQHRGSGHDDRRRRCVLRDHPGTLAGDVRDPRLVDQREHGDRKSVV